MNTLENIRERFQHLQSANGNGQLGQVQKNAFQFFDKNGLPTTKQEDWKYTRINLAFNKDFEFKPVDFPGSFSSEDLDAVHLPGHEAANVLVFLNGRFSASHSHIRSPELVVIPLDKAVAGEYSELVLQHLGDSSRYAKDGIHAMNTAFAQEGIFIYINEGEVTGHPVYLYYISDARDANILSQPRNLVYISQRAQVQLIETYATIGLSESFTNQVMEVIVEKDAIVEYYKIQNDAVHTSQVSTTHFRMVGKSFMHAVTISLNGAIVRNNLNIALEAAYSEAHLYGLYFLNGNSHIDNHTIVDNIQPNCQSNELYKGIIDDKATAVFNGKIFVRQPAQKTNAFQSNKNVLLSDYATINTKPQLEIFADDVKCSHGCTVGKLDEEGMFYLRSRGISEKIARSLLVHAYVIDILEKIKLVPIRNYVDQLISERLEYELV